jgi:diguanylate cyclase (GGDEF)-like protein/PAS domain S-box-containing protein
MDTIRTRVVLIEDDPNLARQIRSMLAATPDDSIEFVWVKSLTAALKLLKRSSGDVALLDVDSSGSKTAEAVAYLRSQLPTVPVVVMSAAADTPAVAHALEAGAKEHFVKGQKDLASLLRAIRHAADSDNADQLSEHAHSDHEFPIPQEASPRSAVHAEIERQREEALRIGQNRILELIATSSPLETVLDALTRLIESQFDGLLCSILLLDQDGKHLRHGAAPSLPKEYVEAIDGEQIGPCAGSCGTAMYRRKPVIVSDIQQDPLWANWRHLAAPHGLRACWSDPIISTQGKVLGSFAMYYRNVRTPGSEDWRLINVATHIARIAIEQKQMEQTLRREEERARLIVETAFDAFVGMNSQGAITAWNSEAARLFGWSAQEAIGRSVAQTIVPERYRDAYRRELEHILATGEGTLLNQRFEFFAQRRDGQEIPVELAVWQLHTGGSRTFNAFIHDITERKRAEAELTHHLTHDLTTGLPRFALMEDYLLSALAAAAAQDGRVVVLYVDLDYFHVVNETRGRSIGDEVLRTVAGRLSAVVGTSGKVAHVAGDEFAVIQIDANRKHDQIDSGESVRAVVAEPIEIADQQIYVTCSVGVSCFPDNATTPQDLLRQAEAAMMRTKREGRNAVSAFSNDQSDELEVRLSLGSRLRSAIRDEHLLLHYQPQISGLNWQILGFEALVRWQDPDLGFVMPKRFIQAAEELGLILDLGRFVLNAACRQARAWIDAGASDFSIAVNISPLQLQRSEFVEDVRLALTKFQVPARCIELELTESVMAGNVERMIGTMQALKVLGVRLALDDFGTGYSSLNYLRRFPIDCLKIDQSFVSDVTSDASSAGICRAVIILGHQLGMQVLAEGVETAAQVGYLKRNGCDLFQGYYFSKPVTADKALEMLRHRYLAHDDISHDKQVQTLLLVDDEANILNALTRALRRDGYRILTATCAEEALDLLAREEVHVIVSDQRMPGMSGTELLSKVKGMHPETVRIVLSGYTDLGAVTKAINQGAIYKFLTKPWNDEELRLQIQDAFRTHKSRIAARTHPGLDDRTAT